MCATANAVTMQHLRAPLFPNPSNGWRGICGQHQDSKEPCGERPATPPHQPGQREPIHYFAHPDGKHLAKERFGPPEFRRLQLTFLETLLSFYIILSKGLPASVQGHDLMVMDQESDHERSHGFPGS